MFKLIAIVACLCVLTGCVGTPYWVLEGEHTSNPGRGNSLNERCDSTAEFLGGGVGTEIQHDRSTTELEVTAGVQRILACGAEDDTDFGMRFSWKQKIPMRR